jgi:hypothetical protein
LLSQEVLLIARLTDHLAMKGVWALLVLPRGDGADLAISNRADPTFAKEKLRERLPLGDDFKAGQERQRILSPLRGDVGTILIAPAHDEPLASVVKTIGAVAGAIRSDQIAIALTMDRAALEEIAASAGPRVSLYPLDTKITGLLSKEVLRQSLWKNEASLVSCYKAARARGSVALPLKVPMSFTLDSSGTASDVEVTEPAVAACLESALPKLELAAPTRGKATVTTTIVFDAAISPH